MPASELRVCTLQVWELWTMKFANSKLRVCQFASCELQLDQHVSCESTSLGVTNYVSLHVASILQKKESKTAG